MIPNSPPFQGGVDAKRTGRLACRRKRFGKTDPDKKEKYHMKFAFTAIFYDVDNLITFVNLGF